VQLEAAPAWMVHTARAIPTKIRPMSVPLCL
jgi:hypothetical protein